MYHIYCGFSRRKGESGNKAANFSDIQCTKTVRTRDKEKFAALFPDSSLSVFSASARACNAVYTIILFFLFLKIDDNSSRHTYKKSNLYNNLYDIIHYFFPLLCFSAGNSLRKELLLIHSVCNQLLERLHYGLFILFVGNAEPFILCLQNLYGCLLLF